MVKNIVAKFIENNSFDKYVVAYSGGVDSQALLHAFAQLVPEKVVAFHVNHGISKNAQKWEDFCSKNAADFGVQFKVAHFDLKGVSNLEDKARIARYGAFSEVIDINTTLLTGHHMDDQVETFFLNLMRGSGIDGLAAMPEVKEFHTGYHSRPFLNISKDDLKEYAIANNLLWVEDESNDDSIYDRNFIRNEVMPLIKTRWDNAAKSISKSVSHIQSSKKYIESKFNEIDIDFKKESIEIETLLKLDDYEQKELVRNWVLFNLGKRASLNMINSIFDNIIPAKDDAKMKWEQKGYFISRFSGKLFFVKTTRKQYDLDDIIKKAGIKIDKSELTFKTRVSGAKIKVNGINKEVKKLFQVFMIPVWERDTIPFIYYGETLISVGGIINDSEYQ